MDGSLWLFLGVSAIVIMTPGQDTALTIRNAVAGGRGGGIATALGVAAGQAIWALAAAVGLVAVLTTVEPLFVAVKLAGAGYLVFLGAQSLWAALRGHGTPGSASADGVPPAKAVRSAFAEGVVSNLGNPKMAVFFASLLPQFVPADAPPFAAMALLGLLFCVMTLCWLSLYALTVARLGRLLRRPAVRRWLDAIAGTALVALGLRVAASEA